MDQLSASVRWSVPDDARRNALLATRRQMMAMWARLISVTALILWAAHHLLAPSCDPDFPWARISLLMLGYPSALAIIMLIGTLETRRKATDYALTTTGVLLPRKEHPIIRWDRIVSFSVQSHPRLQNLRMLSLHLVEGMTRYIVLPGGAKDEAILSELQNRLPEGPPPAKHAPLRQIDWLCGIGIAAAAIWYGGIVLGHYMQTRHQTDFVGWIMAIGFLAGPGTWIGIALAGRRATAQLILLALVINFVSTMGVIMFGGISHLAPINP